MDVLIDGSPDKIKASESDTLAGVLYALRLRLLEDDRVILHIKLDGKTLSPDGEEKLAKEPVSRFSTLTVASNSRKKLAQSALGEITGLLDSLAEDHQCAAQSAIRGLDKEAAEAVGLITEKWQIVSEALVDVCSFFENSGETADRAAGSLIEPLGKLKQVLATLADTIRKTDYILTADVLTYELEPLAETFRQAVVGFENYLGQGESGPGRPA
jgi:hypothetical protein